MNWKRKKDRGTIKAGMEPVSWPNFRWQVSVCKRITLYTDFSPKSLPSDMSPFLPVAPVGVGRSPRTSVLDTSLQKSLW